MNPKKTLVLGAIFALLLFVIVDLAFNYYALSKKLKNLSEEKTFLEREKSECYKELNEKLSDLEKVREGLKGSICIDSDINEKPFEEFVKGYVIFIGEDGQKQKIYDECAGNKKQVVEKYCYESPKGSENFVVGSLVKNCAQGCLDGKCLGSPSVEKLKICR